MKFGEFMAGVRRSVPHVVLLAGEERYYTSRAEQAILAKLVPSGDESAVQRVTDIGADDLIAMVETIPFFNPTNVIVVKNFALFRESKKADGVKSKKDDAAARLSEALENIPEFSYVIFVSDTKADKRKKLYKTIEKCGAVLDAEPIKAWNINEWLQGKLQSMNRDLDREAREYFVSAVSMMREVSLEFLDSELDKLAMFTDRRVFTRADLVKVFAGLPEVSVFALMDAISEQNARRALVLLKRQLADGTYFTVLITLLTRHVRQLWQIKELAKKGIRGRAVAKPLELNPFIAERLARAAARFDEQTLKRAMLELIDADYYLKTGQAGDEILEHSVITLCQKKYD